MSSSALLRRRLRHHGSRTCGTADRRAAALAMVRLRSPHLRHRGERLGCGTAANAWLRQGR